MVEIKVHPFEHHTKIKKELLKLIDNADKELKDNISFTDYYLDHTKPKAYLQLFFDHMKEHMQMQCEVFNSKKCIVTTAWFHQYKKGSDFDWHAHDGCNFSCVYFLELPNQELATEFANYKCPKIEEGDILIFPSFMYHRSPINKTNNRKTIISWNCDFYEWNGKNGI